MQVMNTNDFSEKQVLIGQSAKTEAFSVSDDPMLMSMLSTGFYANPLRTMIQETMFNAWDAHRMAEITDTPIDIYISTEGGLIFRDYGHGIPDNEMHVRYCVYGNSTKRADKRQTGGFGLGCKSPFAYTESFTVTSHNEGVKHVYLISRVSDDNGGKPGLTRLVNVPTDQSGLMVNIPLDNREHARMAKTYLMELKEFSGVKFRLHFEDDEPEIFEDDGLAAGDYAVSTKASSTSVLTAVYGGVKYRIPMDEEYKEEFKFVEMIGKMYPLHIGFAPDSLTPLPSREGLNMSKKTKESIKIGLEMCMEKFQLVFDPLIHTLFRHLFDNSAKMGIQPQFALYQAFSVTNHSNNYSMVSFTKKLEELVPLNSDKTVWQIACQMLHQNPNVLLNVLTEKRWMTIINFHFCRTYPDHKQIGFQMMKPSDSFQFFCGPYQRGLCETSIAFIVNPPFIRTLHSFERKLMTDMKYENAVHPRVFDSSNSEWVPTVRSVGKTKPSISVLKTQSVKEDEPDYFTNVRKNVDYPDQLWNYKTEEAIDHTLITNVVILAKSVASLKETNQHQDEYTSGDYLKRNEISRIGQYSYNSRYGRMLGYVVKTKDGAYDRAVEILTEMGIKIIHGVEPTRKTSKKVNVKPSVPVYQRLVPHLTLWREREQDIRQENLIENPTHYFYSTDSSQTDSYLNYREFPSKELISEVLKRYPDTVKVSNSAIAESLEKKGVKPISAALSDMYEEINQKKVRMRNITRFNTLIDKSEIPYCMLRSQTIQKVCGMIPIDINDKEFWEISTFLNLLADSSYRPIKDLTEQVGKDFVKVRKSDPKKEYISKVCTASDLFSKHDLRRKWESLSPVGKSDFSKTFAKVLKAMV